MRVKYLQTRKPDSFDPFLPSETNVDYYHVWDLEKTIIKGESIAAVSLDYLGLEELIRSNNETLLSSSDFTVDEKIISDLLKKIGERDRLTMDINQTMQTLEIIRE